MNRQNKLRPILLSALWGVGVTLLAPLQGQDGAPEKFNDLPDITLTTGTASEAVADLGTMFRASGVDGQLVCFTFAAGNVYLELLEDDAPIAVANFLEYVDDGSYSNSLIHRAVPGFVLQGGGYVYGETFDPITTRDPITNEFSLSNLRGTLSMAKLGGDPDSATSQFFINLADNSGNLDSQNGGFTVFAKVLGDGMDIADTIADLTIVNAGGPFTDLPITDPDADPADATIDDFVTMQKAERSSLFGDFLTTAVSSSNTNNVTASVDGNNVLNIQGQSNSEWEETITVTVSDPYGNQAEDSFVVTSNGSSTDGGGTDGGGTDGGGTDGDGTDGGTDGGGTDGGGTDGGGTDGGGTDGGGTDGDGTDGGTDGGTDDGGTDDGGTDSGNTGGTASGALSNSTSVGSGWYHSDWFGFHYPTNEGWINHEHLGWLYIGEDNGSNAWIWQPFFGWLWMDSTSYSWIWRNDRSAWMFYDQADPAALIFYDTLDEFWFEYFPAG